MQEKLKNLFALIFVLLSLVGTSCNDVDKPTPQATEVWITMNGELLPEQVYNIPLKPAKVEWGVAPVRDKDAQLKDIHWYLNGNEVKGTTETTLEMVPEYSGTLKVVVKNDAGMESEAELALQGVFREGMFFYGSTNVGVSFYNPTADNFVAPSKGFKNIYTELNDDELGKGGVNDLTFFHNKIYFLLPSSEKGNARVVIADAQTLRKIDVVTALDFKTGVLGEIYNLAVVSDDKAYIGHNKSSAGNKAGVRALDMKSKTLSADIPELSGDLGVNGPAWQRMMVHGDDLLVICGDKLQVLDTKTDKLKKSVSINESSLIADVLRGSDKNLYLLVSGTISNKSNPSWLFMPQFSTPAQIVKLDGKSYEVLEKKELKYEKDGKSEDIQLKCGLRANGAVMSPISDVIYFIKDAGWVSSEIYTYDCKMGKVDFFADPLKADGIYGPLSGYMGADKKGNVYVAITDYTRSKIVMFDHAGKFVKTLSVEGDGSVISTYMN